MDGKEMVQGNMQVRCIIMKRKRHEKQKEE